MIYMEQQILKATKSPVMDKLLLDLNLQFFAENKVKFGLENVHYAIQNDPDPLTKEVTFGEYMPWEGAVNLTLTPRGGQTEFYADNRAYYVTTVNNGFDGTYEAAEMPQDFRINVLDEALTTDNILVEKRNAKVKLVALAFQFSGDAKETRHVVYGVKFTRPTITGATTTDTSEPQTISTTFIANGLKTPTLDITKASTTGTTPNEAYNSFFDAVYVPTLAETLE